MGKRILLIQGHPDPCQDHLCHTLADAYAGGARAAGHELRTTTVAQLDFPLLRNEHEWQQGALPDALRKVQDDIFWAQHMVIFFPLWLGDMPALFKGFLERHHGHAGLALPPLLSRPQHQVAQAQRAGVRWHLAST
jgi:putative NADPH-quinone reductase